MTKEKVDALLKALDRLDLGAEDGDATNKLQSARGDTVLMSATLDLFVLTAVKFSTVLWNGSRKGSAVYPTG